MHIPWTTYTAASCLLPLASAFYPYNPSSPAPPRRRTALPYNSTPRSASRITLPLHRIPRDNAYPILHSASPGDKNSVAIDQDGADLSYMAAVTLGDSKESYHLLLDSAAGNTWVMGSACGDKACGRHNTFGEGDSGTLKVRRPIYGASCPSTVIEYGLISWQMTSTPFSITYGTGSVSGTAATDALHIASLSVALTLGLATNVSSEFDSYPMDGILGLGRGTASSLGDASTLLDALKTAGLIPARTYGMRLSRAADGANDGVLTLGSVDADAVDGDILWLDGLDNDTGFWEVGVSDAGVGTARAGLKGKSAIVDSGTSYVFLPPSDALALHELVEGYTQSGETFSVPCGTTEALSFSFGDVSFAVSAKDWVGASTGDGLCRSNVFGRQTFGEDQWLLGDVFLKNVYAAFDLDGGKVGFGKVKSGTEESSSSSAASSAPTGSATKSVSAESSAGASSASATASAAVLLPPGASATSTADTVAPSSSASTSTAKAQSESSAGIPRVPALLYLAYVLLPAFLA